MLRPRPLSVAEVAAALQASDAYVRRLLIGQRLHGIKVGSVWAVYEEDLEAFRQMRRPPGRPRKVTVPDVGTSEPRPGQRRRRRSNPADPAAAVAE
jgi:excisionase family DNA binding protein